MRRFTMTVVWDRLVRFVHWSVALAFAANFFNESGSAWHRYIGYAAAGLVLLRLGWGMGSSGYARFANWWPDRAGILSHLRALLAGRAFRHLGITPLGALMAGAIWLQIGLLALTGWLMGTDAFWGEEWLQDLHEAIAYVLLACVCVHVAAVLAASIRQRENLPKAMIDGKKRAL